MSYTYALPLLAGEGGFAHEGQPGVATKHYLLGDKRIAQREGRAGPVTYLYHDHLGSTVASSQQESARHWRGRSLAQPLWPASSPGSQGYPRTPANKALRFSPGMRSAASCTAS